MGTGTILNYSVDDASPFDALGNIHHCKEIAGATSVAQYQWLSISS
jgi:hypothetical protein